MNWCRWVCGHFGRITAERRRAELLDEARRNAAKHAVHAVDCEAVAARAAIDQRHHAELAHFYKSTVVRLSATQEKP